MEKNREQCELVVALDAIVGKWKPMIIQLLIKKGTLRFNELRRHMPDITQRMLTLHLRELEQHDIVKRVIYAQVPPKVEYSLTDYGQTLIPVMETIHEWGAAHLERLKLKREQTAAEQTSQA